MPVRLKVCGLVTALSVRVSVPFTVPEAAGENVTLTVQVAPAPRLAPQVVLDTLKLALVERLAMLIAVPKRLVTVTFCGTLVVPAFTLPKFKDLTENVTGALPVPVSFTVCGLFRAASVNVNVPVKDATAAGAKVMLTLQFARPAMLDPQVFEEIANGLAVAIPVKVSVEVVWFVSVTDLAVLVLPATTDPKLTVADDSVTCAVPEPLRLTV